MNIEAMRTVSAALSKGRITLAHAGWAVLLSTLGLWAIGVHAIDLARPDGAIGLAASAERQIYYLVAGVFGALIFTLPHYRWLAVLAWPMMTGVVAALVFLLVPSPLVTPRNGARCWIDLGFTDVQPSELGKVAYVVVLAVYLRHRANHRRLFGLIPPALIAALPMGLILLQPDLGTALLFIPTLVCMLVAAGARMFHLISACALGALFLAGVIGVSLFLARDGKYPLLKPYQVDRIAALAERMKGDTRRVSDRGFQGQAAVMVAGAGGAAGHAEERSRALVRFSGLPERHNDMIFAVVMNRFGLLGALTVIGLYMTWIGGALLVAAGCKDPFGRLVVVGFAGMIATQMTINIGMNLGILPITGITLPFVSYGGSSLISGMIMVGIIFSIAMRRPEHLWRRSFEFDARE